MDNVERTEEIVLSAPAIDMSFGHEGGGDFSLPDYLPAILRLVNVTAAVLPETKFLSGSVLELGGTLAYNILYAGESGEISCASFVSEYSASTALPSNAKNAADIFWECETESTSCRVTGPRSINIKSRLKSRLMSDEHIFGEGEVLDADGKCARGQSAQTVEKLTKTVESIVRRYGVVTGNAVGEIKCDAEYRPIMCEGALHPTVCELSADTASVNGEIRVRCLFGNDEGAYRDISVSMPFESAVHIADMPPEANIRAWGRVASVSVARSESADDTFNVSLEYDLEAEAWKRNEAVLWHDAYSTSYECDTESRDADFLKMVCFGTRQLTVNGECEIKNSPEGAHLVCVVGQVSGVQAVCLDGKPTVNAVLKLKAVIAGAGEVTVPECDIPIKFEIPDKADTSNTDFQSRAVCSVLSANGKTDGTKVKMTAELSIGYEVLEKQKTKYLTAVRLKDDVPNDAIGSEVRVYYPSRDESLWSICKKYHADQSRVVRHNDIDSDTVPAGKPIIIL